MKRIAVLVASAALVLAGSLPAAANPTAPYGNAATQKVAKQLGTKHRGGWLAVTLDIGGYHGPRQAEIGQIPAGHGKRWVGIIHVKKKSQRARVRAALGDVAFAQRAGRFVVPLKTKYRTDGCRSIKCVKATRWAAKRLGGWKTRNT